MLADAVASMIDAFQRMVNLLQQVQKVRRLGFGDCRFQLLPPDHQLVTQHMQICNLDCHEENSFL